MPISSPGQGPRIVLKKGGEGKTWQSKHKERERREGGGTEVWQTAQRGLHRTRLRLRQLEPNPRTLLRRNFKHFRSFSKIYFYIRQLASRWH